MRDVEYGAWIMELPRTHTYSGVLSYSICLTGRELRDIRGPHGESGSANSELCLVDCRVGLSSSVAHFQSCGVAE